MLSCTASPSMRVDRSGSGGRSLSQESLDRADGALDGGELVGVELAQEPLDRLDAHGPPARKRSETLLRRVHAYHASVVAVSHLPRDAGSLHLAREAAHGRRANLLGRRELPERL